MGRMTSWVQTPDATDPSKVKHGSIWIHAETDQCPDVQEDDSCVSEETAANSDSCCGKLRSLSIASTATSPPSPCCSSVLSSPADQPIPENMALGAAALDLEAAALNYKASDDTTSERSVSDAQRKSNLPEYEIHDKANVLPEDEPGLRVRLTFVEAWVPPPRLRRSRSAPASWGTYTKSSARLPLGPSEWLQRCVPPPPSGSPPCFQPSNDSSPPPPVFDLHAAPSATPFWQAETSTESYDSSGYWQTESSPSWMPSYSNGSPTWAQQSSEAPAQFFIMGASSQAYSSGECWAQDCTGAGNEEDSSMHMTATWGRTDTPLVVTCKHFVLSGTEQARRKGALSMRKIPASDHQRALNIICCARQSLTQNYRSSAQELSVWDMAHQDKHSSANVQTALEIAASTGYENNTPAGWNDAWALIASFQGRVRQAFESPSANFVLSKIFEVMPTPIVSCLVEELKGLALDAAKHRYGCRCMVRLIRYHIQQAEEDSTVWQVINELLRASAQLSHTQFGTHVVQELLDAGLPEHQAAVAQSLKGNLLRGSRNRFSARVVEKAILTCSTSNVDAMLEELLSGHGALLQLVNNEFGVRVVKALMGREQAKRTAELLTYAPAEVASTRSGKMMLQQARNILATSDSSGSSQRKACRRWA